MALDYGDGWGTLSFVVTKIEKGKAGPQKQRGQRPSGVSQLSLVGFFTVPPMPSAQLVPADPTRALWYHFVQPPRQVATVSLVGHGLPIPIPQWLIQCFGSLALQPQGQETGSIKAQH